MMSVSDKTRVDPLLQDLDEKKESFRRNVVSLAAELKQVRGRLVTQEQSLFKETLTRKEAEKRGKNLETEICKLQKRLEDRNSQLEASASAAEKFIKELEELRLHLDKTNQTAEESDASSQSTQLQCSMLKKQLEDKTASLRDHENRVTQLGHQLDDLRRDLSLRKCSEKQLREEVMRIEREITEAITKGKIGRDFEFQKLLEEVSPMSFEKFNKLVEVKDEEVIKLKDEVRLMSAHWRHKTKELEAQLEKQRRTDQDLKKKILKLEFCLQEARSQTRKLHRKGEKRDKEIKEVRDLMMEKQRESMVSWEKKQNFWDNSGFKIVVSMSMLMLVVVSKR